MDSHPAKLGSSIRIHGLACPNESCSHYQCLVMWGIWCERCGTELKPASASVAVFKWENQELDDE